MDQPHAVPSLLLNEEQMLLRKTARQLVESSAPVSRLRSFRDDNDSIGFSTELWREVAELGWLGLQIPDDFGGLGLGFLDLCVVLEESGRALMPEPFVSTLLLATQTLLLGGNQAQQQALLSGIASGDKIVSLGFEETGCRDPLSEMRTIAKTSGDQFELTGEKTHVLDAHVADAIIVSAETSESPGPEVVSTLFLVDPAQPGVHITRQRRIDGQNAAIVRLDGVLVPRGNVIGEVDGGALLLDQVFDRARIGLAAHMLGGSERAFEMTLAYLKEREQFGVPIGSFQALQHRAVALYTEIALLRSAVLAAARAVDETPDEVPRLAALANGLGSETFMHVAKEAIQMHGGIGVTDEHDVGLYIKRAQATYVSFGDPQFHRKRWAELHGY